MDAKTGDGVRADVHAVAVGVAVRSLVGGLWLIVTIEIVQFARGGRHEPQTSAYEGISAGIIGGGGAP